MTERFVDRRGVSEVIGSILVFGLVVALLTILQTQAVPSTNEDIEFQHSQEVQGDFARLSDAVTRSAVRGTSETVTLETGTTYPNRLVLFNPPPATGQLRSGEETPVYLANVAASDPEAREYVDGALGYTPGNAGVGNAPVLSTAGVSYRPQYNQYRGAPVTRSEYGVVYDEYDDETLVERRPEIVDGKSIDLRFLTGDYRESGLTTTVRTEPVSAGGSPLPVRSTADLGGSGSLQLYLPTDLPASVWTTDLLAGAIDDPDGGANGAAPEAGDSCQLVEGTLNGPGASPVVSGTTTQASSFGSPDPDNDRYVADCLYVTDPDGQNYVVLVFESGVEYGLTMSKVGLESGESLDPQYVVPSQSTVSLRPSGRQQVSAQVRDRYNNPVSGVELTADLSTAGNAPVGATLETATASGGSVTVTTDENGVATVSVDAEESFRGVDVTFSGAFDADPAVNDPEMATVSVGSPTPEPVVLQDAAITADDTVTLTLVNEGRERTVTDVQVADVSIVDRKTALSTASGSASGSVLDLDLVITDVTNELDGPEAIDGLYVVAPGDTGTFVDLATAATEGEAPQPTDTGALETLPTDETREIGLRLDQPLPSFTDAEDAVTVRVTLTYSGGYRQTYDLRLESDDDDER